MNYVVTNNISIKIYEINSDKIIFERLDNVMYFHMEYVDDISILNKI